jgi:hypothetical protein
MRGGAVCHIRAISAVAVDVASMDGYPLQLDYGPGPYEVPLVI